MELKRPIEDKQSDRIRKLEGALMYEVSTCLFRFNERHAPKNHDLDCGNCPDRKECKKYKALTRDKEE
jgi:hypothetical protein